MLKRYRKKDYIRKLASNSMFQKLLRRLERVAPADGGIKKWLRDNSPDIVVVTPTNLRKSEEIEYVKAANALGIPSVIPIHTWDNLTTKGLIHVLPGMTLVWNSKQHQEAIEIHNIPESRLLITGSVTMDKWFRDDENPISESEFRQRVGLNQNEEYVLYLGSSTNITGNESALLQEFASCLSELEQDSSAKLKILARPHPANEFGYGEIPNDNVIPWLRGRDELPDSPETFADYRASLKYASCIVGVNTTGMVDALLMDKAVISLLSDDLQTSNAANAIHFRYLTDAKVYVIANTSIECAELALQIRNGEDPQKQFREEFVQDFIRPRGLNVNAGAIAAQAIEMFANRHPVSEINSALASADSGVSLRNTVHSKIA
jgi:hypothetical protein